MIAANIPVQRPHGAKLLHVDPRGQIVRLARSDFVSLLRPGDVVIANDAAALPASLFGIHRPSGRSIEARLAGRSTLAEVTLFSAILFGEGDFHTRTEDRPLPPPIGPGDWLELGPLRAVVARTLGHPRHVLLRFEGTPGQIWEGLARHGRPIQYAHIPAPLAVWDTWTTIAGPPVAFEAPSAGFVLDWRMLARMASLGVQFATITHAAGISSTGDAEIDARLPFDEPYRIAASTARLIAQAQARGSRIIAIGTSVVRALEHSAAMFDGHVPAGEQLATQKITSISRLRVVDAILSGTHEEDSSHHDLISAFANAESLTRMGIVLNEHDFRTHEYGDSIFVEKAISRVRCGILLPRAAVRPIYIAGLAMSQSSLIVWTQSGETEIDTSPSIPLSAPVPEPATMKPNGFTFPPACNSPCW